ncbi:MAG: hypothetical protein ACRD2G_19030 [Terriglobia bacterium]
MTDLLAVHGLQYVGYAIEIVLLALLLTRGRWKSAKPFFLYFAGYFALDTLLRPAVLYIYGFSSLQYRYTYWMTDILLTLGAFLLICLLFRRACSGKPEVWSYLRSMLAAVFIIIAFISYFSLAHHYDHLFSRFIVGLQENLYFTCLVLNTLLYIMLQQWDSVDERLSLLVCGLGIEFAGPAAGMALAYLTPGGHDAGILTPLVSQMCNLGMCMVWLYAMAQKPVKVSATGDSQEHAARARSSRDLVLAEVPVRSQ